MTKPVIILVQPQLGENIGAVARAMFNFGLTDLRIVSPRDGWPNPTAIANAAHALPVIQNAIIFTCLGDALHDISCSFATTARSRFMNKEIVTPKQMVEITRIQHASNNKSAVIFGGERSGLDNDDAALANYLVSIAVNPECSSINIAHAAAILCYELYNYEQPYIAPVQFVGILATQQQVTRFLQELENLLEEREFFRWPEKKNTMIRNIGNIFKRIKNFTTSDIDSLYGIIYALLRSK